MAVRFIQMPVVEKVMVVSAEGALTKTPNETATHFATLNGVELPDAVYGDILICEVQEIELDEQAI